MSPEENKSEKALSGVLGNVAATLIASVLAVSAYTVLFYHGWNKGLVPAVSLFEEVTPVQSAWVVAFAVGFRFFFAQKK